MSAGDAANDPVQEPDAALSAARRRLTWGGVAWLFVLAAIGTVQVVRAQFVDAAIFFTAALVLVLDAAGTLPLGSPMRRPRLRVLILAGAAVAVALSVTPRHGALAAVVVIATGVGAAVIAWPPPARRDAAAGWPRALRTLAISWAVIWVLACVWELIQFVLGGTTPGGRAEHPALSDLLDPIGAPGIGQAALAVAWVAAGIFLVPRGGTR